MKKDENEKLPHFKDIWTHIPPQKKYNDIDTLSDWVKSIVDKVEGKAGKESKILVVDDELEVLNSLKLILEHSGYSVDTA
ncbi:MAG: hypothetical protein ACFFD2_30240, partial [Promethearchaeota archaeon]